MSERKLSKPPPGVPERRSDQEFFQEMLASLSTMHERYIRFTSRVLLGGMVLVVGVAVSLYIGGRAATDARNASEAARDLTVAHGRLLARVDADAVTARRTARQSTDALCALRGELRDRVTASQDFLRENPEGIPGIPDELLRDRLREQRRAVGALSPLRCSRSP